LPVQNIISGFMYYAENNISYSAVLRGISHSYSPQYPAYLFGSEGNPLIA